MQLSPKVLLLNSNKYLLRRGSLSGPENRPTMDCNTWLIFIVLDFRAFINSTKFLYSSAVSFSLTCRHNIKKKISSSNFFITFIKKIKINKNLLLFFCFKKKHNETRVTNAKVQENHLLWKKKNAILGGPIYKSGREYSRSVIQTNWHLIMAYKTNRKKACNNDKNISHP